MTDRRVTLPALAALPEFEAPAALWPRIIAADLRRRRRRHATRFALSAAAVAALAFGVHRTSFTPAMDHPQAGQIDAATRDALQRSQFGEAQQRGEQRMLPPELLAQISALDGALQAAYDRQASEAELRALWRERARLLHARAEPVSESDGTHVVIDRI